MPALTGLLLALLGALQYQLWTGQGGLRQLRELREAREVQLSENRDLLERNRALEAEVADLKAGLEAVEERARSEMGMIKSDEVFYQVIDRDRSEDTAAGRGE